MGKALYRKYRSKNLDEIVGQEHIVTALKNAIKSRAPSHAYLLTGPRGVGKTSVARILAHEVNGLPYTDESAHLDIIEIDAASNNGVDNVRDLREKIYVAPTVGKYKVYIIDEVHMLSKAAFNALLKTLEEPPEHAIFILATTEAHKLPETIISRTQRFTFKPIESSKVVGQLKDIASKEKIKIDGEALELIAKHGEGSFRDSISLLDQVRSMAQQITAAEVRELVGEPPAHLLNNISGALSRQDKAGLVSALNDLDSQGYESAAIAKQLGTALLQALLSGEEAPLNEGQRLNLLNKLIGVQASPEPFISLELALLEAITNPSQPSPAINSDLAKPKTAKNQSPVPLQEKTQPTPQVEKPEPSGSAKKTRPIRVIDNDTWDEVLAAIKTQHNTLYSVLRMASPEWQGNELTLTFGFNFHQKRISEPKNQSIITTTIRDLTGHEVSVNCVVDSSLAVAAAPKETETTAEPIPQTISNIFGSAELLESEH